MSERVSVGILPTIQLRISSLPACSLETQRLKYIKTIILSVVLFGCEASSRTLREESENTVPRGTFRQKRRELTGGWTILFNDELHNLHSSPVVTLVMK
jgi:hypothetical protein